MKKIIVGISGASGSIYGIDLLEKLSKVTNIETHLVMSNWAKENIKLETDYSVAEVENLADFVYDNQNLGAAIASGSEDLIMRAACVLLKEQRKLILVPRETPLSPIHLENLTKLAKLGVHIIPPIPSFYDHPKTIQDIIDHQTMKVLDSLDIEADFAKRWDGE